MGIAALAWSMVNPAKPVQVQLPLKGLVLGLIEVASHDSSSILFRLMNLERLAAFVPGNHVGEASTVRIF